MSCRFWFVPKVVTSFAAVWVASCCFYFCYTATYFVVFFACMSFTIDFISFPLFVFNILTFHFIFFLCSFQRFYHYFYCVPVFGFLFFLCLAVLFWCTYMQGVHRYPSHFWGRSIQGLSYYFIASGWPPVMDGNCVCTWYTGFPFITRGWQHWVPTPCQSLAMQGPHSSQGCRSLLVPSYTGLPFITCRG